MSCIYLILGEMFSFGKVFVIEKLLFWKGVSLKVLVIRDEVKDNVKNSMKVS